MARSKSSIPHVFIKEIVFLLVLGVALFSIAKGAGSSEPGRGSGDLATAIINVAKQTIPAVVHIEVTERQEVANPFFPFENDPFFRHFFGAPNMPKKFERELKGIGTGMIIDPEGHILTNNHVAGGATKIKVLLSDGREYPDKVEVGEWVVAIGHPRGLDQTVTQGIISAKHRRGITDPSSYQDFLQTDAAINPGNSGGPLLNLQGEVIGVNAAIASQSGGFEGIGFAIPSNMASFVTRALLAHGKVERAWLGVSVQNLTPSLAKSFGMSTPRGALVADVTSNGPAAKAGIKRGDVIISYQGKEVPDADTLRNETAVSPINKDVKVTVWRDGKVMEFTVKMEGMKAASEAMAVPVKERLGAAVSSLNSKEAEQYGLNSNQGVVITWLDPKGPLARVGFEIGDIILEINGEAVETPEGLADMLSSVQRGQSLTILALDHRTGNTGYIRVAVR
jgi:serine protease Do